MLVFAPWCWAHCCPSDLGWKVLWFLSPGVSHFSSQGIRGVGMGERCHGVPQAPPRWGSARVLPWCRRVFGLERTQQPIPGCSQPYRRTCRCIKSGTSLCVLTLHITPLVFRGAVLIPFHYVDLYLLVLLFITASNNLYHAMTIVGFNSSLPPWTCGGFIFFFYPCLCFLLQLIFPGYAVRHLFQPHISYFFFH